MNLHEYMAKDLLAKNGVPVPRSVVLKGKDELKTAFDQFKGKKCIIKAQVHAGGRGKAGGVRAVETFEDFEYAVTTLLGSNLVTHQTNADGQPVNALLLEEPCVIKRELYIALTVDRTTHSITCMASNEGGMDIESVSTDKIFKFNVDFATGILPYQCRNLAFKLKLNTDQIKQFTRILSTFYNTFVKHDLTMLEVNPLIIDDSDNLICLDAKVSLDENALYRHPDLAILYDPSQEDEKENKAKESDLSYIALNGQIGCMVNGAGLAMATMDLIKLSGGSPANFLDVGGAATVDRVKQAFQIILSDLNVKVIFVNIFGGIVSCATIAEGILAALANVKTSLPVVVRLVGNNHAQAAKILAESNLNIYAENDFSSAANKAVDLAHSKEF